MGFAESGRGARTKWSTLVAVCRECSDGKAVAKALKQAYKLEGRRDVRVVRTSCLDVCPKRGATVSTTTARGVATVVMEKP